MKSFDFLEVLSESRRRGGRRKVEGGEGEEGRKRKTRKAGGKGSKG